MSVDAIAALRVDDTHPSLPGHFPGTPIVPGVVLLSEVLADLRRQLPHVQVVGIKKVKFLQMLRPGQQFTVEFGAPAANSLRFKCRQDGMVFAEGNFSIPTADPPQA